MKPHLVSFKTCPFVRRSVIVLLKKKVDFDVTYVDLASKPEWFVKISPTGKVPILRLGEDVLFESSVINEYLDETHPPSLHPTSPLERARSRAWIEVSSTLLVDLWALSTADKQAAFANRLAVIRQKLAKFEEVVRGPFFNGKDFHLIDAAIAPAFDQMDLIEQRYKVTFGDKLLNVNRWRDALLADEAVKKSVVDDFEELFFNSLAKSDKSALNELKIRDRFA